MITQLLLDLLGVLFDAFMTIITPLTWGGEQITETVSGLVLEIRRYNHFAPVSEFLVLSTVHLSIFTSVTVFKWVIWAIRRIADVIP